jgi:hypothetical protein
MKRFTLTLFISFAVVRRGPIPRRTHAIAPPCIETRTCP